MQPNDALLNRKQVAELLGLAPHTLACWQCEGRGPRALKFGRSKSAAIRYRRSEVEAWLANPAEHERPAVRKAAAGERPAKTKSLSRPKRRRPARAR